MQVRNIGSAGIQIASGLVMLLLASCMTPRVLKTHEVVSQADSGAVNIAVTHIAPWDEYVDKLAPNFVLTPEQALEKTLPVTTYAQNRVLDALTGTVGVGLQTRSETKTSTKTETTEQTGDDPAETTNLDQNVVTGTLADGSTPTTTEISVTPPDALGGVREKLGSDPILHYTAATALYQEVQLLKHYVHDAALRSGMDAYVVRLQLEVVPFARNQPYDIHSLLGFFHDDKQSNVMVLPLLVTDNLENSLTSNVENTIRSLAVALTALRGGIGANIGLARKIEVINSVLGSDTNSLLTVGRVTDNTISVRLGAARQATAGHATLPRTHNITLLVMVDSQTKEAGDDEKQAAGDDGKQAAGDDERQAVEDGERQAVEDGDKKQNTGKNSKEKIVRVVNRWRARNALTGEDLQLQSASELVRQLTVELNKDLGLATIDEKKTLELMESMYSNDYKEFDEKIGEVMEVSKPLGLYARDVWLHIAERLQRSPQSGARFELPQSASVKLPPEQSLELVDDGKTAMKVTLQQGATLAATELTAILEIPVGEGSKETFIPSKIETNDRGNVLILTFPSLKKLGLQDLNLAGNKIVGANLKVTHSPDSKWKKKSEGEENYPSVYYREQKTEIKAYVDVKKTVTVVQQKDSKGSIDLHVKFTKSAGKQEMALTEISVDGAEIENATVVGSSTALPISFGSVRVSQDSTVRLNLKNLVPKKTVKISLQTKKSVASKAEGKVIEVEIAVSE